jgi:hypothetical protein
MYEYGPISRDGALFSTEMKFVELFLELECA